MHLVAAIVFAMGSMVCHQKPDRSFFWDGHQFPVCARCTGLYLSGAIGLLGWWVARRVWRERPIVIEPRFAVRALIIATIPTAISVAGSVSGLWDGTNWTRAILALPLGASAGAIVAAVAARDLR